MKPLISVIVPVYGVEKYIEESLRSICVQNIKSMEIIVVNDGTKDSSVEIAKKILKEKNIPYKIIDKENGGLPSARNVGIKEAQGKYVCFIDSDDIISATHLTDLWECCEKNKLIASFAEFQMTTEDARKGVPKCGEIKIYQHDELLQKFLIRKVKIHCCALLIQREYLLANNILFNEKLRYGEDIDFMWRLFPRLDQVGCTGNETYMYLQRKNSLMTDQNIDRVLVLLEEFKKTVNWLMENYPENNDLFKHLFGKASLAFYRTFAESSDYNLFKELLTKSDYRRSIQSVIGIKEIRINLLAIILVVNPKAFYKVVRLKVN